MDELTRLLEAAHDDAGVDSAALFRAAYGELRQLARARLAGGAPLTLIDTTVLVNECWLRLADRETLQVDTRRRFFAFASEVMRSVIVDEVRRRNAAKRGGGLPEVTLETELGSLIADDEVLRVDEALRSLAALEPRLAQVVEMRYFAGMTETQIGETLGLTERTVRRDWEKARLLLRDLLAST
ncbi:MAG: ECF-type sigma factor [Steroidobacteraceae bacterium]